MPEPATEPSAHARASSCAAAYDLHVHVEPDLAKRRIDDLALAHRFLELGLAGFVLKSHYVPTAERAAVVRAAVPGVDALGAITLNAGVGGLNAQAVEIAARGGARIVWLPTVDSENEASEDGPKPAKQPVWRKIQDEFVAAGVAGRARAGVTADGLARVLAVVARHDLVLATGHLGRAEIHTAVDAALAAGVSHVVVTHPDYPTQGVPVEEQRELAATGAMLERCFAPIHTGKVSWEATFEAIRATGAERNVLSTDLGQVANPPVEDGLALMADRLLEAGFAEDEVHTMAVVNTQEARRCRSRTTLVVSAHSADFVWRAAGAIATVVDGRRRGARRLALVRRARRVGGAVEGSPVRPRSGSRRSATARR